MNTNKQHSEILKFDPKKYPFDQILEKLVDQKELDSLTVVDNNLTIEHKHSFYKNMEQTTLFKKLYSNLEGSIGKEFYELYQQFIKEVIRPQYEEAIYFQIKPSHRILFKDLKGQARFHKDSDYGHASSEINYWVPQTHSFDSNSIWIAKDSETREPENHTPVQLQIGEYLKFDGANISHGAMPNETGKTRVSFDFRVIPVSQADKNKDAAFASENNPVMSNAHKFQLCE